MDGRVINVCFYLLLYMIHLPIVTSDGGSNWDRYRCRDPVSLVEFWAMYNGELIITNGLEVCFIFLFYVNIMCSVQEAPRELKAHIVSFRTTDWPPSSVRIDGDEGPETMLSLYYEPF